LIYPVRQRLFDEKRWRSVYLYLPALLLVAVSSFMFLRGELGLLIPAVNRLFDYSPEFAARFYRISFAHFLAALGISAAILIRRFVVSKNTVARQQLKWVVWDRCWPLCPSRCCMESVRVGERRRHAAS
jgi:hypothetical protein